MTSFGEQMTLLEIVQVELSTMALFKRASAPLHLSALLQGFPLSVGLGRKESLPSGFVAGTN